MPKMSPAEAIYHRALEKATPQERAAYLDEACGEDTAMRRRVERLLAAHEHAGSFLEHPAIEAIQIDTPPGHADDTGRDRPLDSAPAGTTSEETPTGLSPRFRLREEIGRGGMGRVLLGRDTDLDREVAVKVLLEMHQGRSDLDQRFLEEARIAGRLQHPGVVPVYEMGRLADQRPFFAMKLVQGQTLAKLLAERKDPTQDRMRFVGVFLQVCQTLAYAHARGVIHRDLKPANVMVGEFGEVQVMDWGLAKSLLPVQEANDVHNPTSDRCNRASQAGPLTDANTVTGTPAYLPPEQARRDAQRSDPRTDVFGLGGILCEILTGEPPFRADSVMSMLKQSVGSDLSDAFSRLDASGADPELVRIAKACLAATPERRPANASVVAEAVSQYLSGVQERLRTAELGQARADARAEGERRRRQLTVALAGAVLLVAVGGGSVAWIMKQQRDRQHEAAGKTLEAVQRGRALLAGGWEDQDLERLGQARSEVTRALDVARSGALDSTVQEEAAALLVKAEERLKRAARNQVLLDALLNVSAPKQTREYTADSSGRMVTLAEKDEDQQFADAFRRWGLDIDGVEHADAMARLRDEPLVVLDGIIAALDNWTLIRRQKGAVSRGQPLQRLAEDLDRDHARRQLRTLLFETPAEDGWSFFWPVANPAPGGQSRRLVQLRGQMDPTTQPVLTVLLLAWASGRAGDLPEAEQVLRSASVARPGDVVLLNALGRMLAAQGPTRLADAIGSYRAARASRPGLGVALATSLSHTGRSADGREAEAILRDLVRRQPDNPELSFALGHFLSRQNRPAEAAAQYRQVIRLKPDFTEAHNNLGVALSAQNRIPEAVAAYREAIRLKQDSPDAHSNLGTALLAQSKLSEAVAACREAVRLNPNAPGTHNNLGVALSAQNQMPEALAAFGEAIRLNPDLPEAHNNLGNALRGLNKLSEAVAAHREAIRLKPDYAEASNNLGIALRAQNKLPEAVAAYREAIRLKPNFPEAHTNLGIALDVQGNAPEAVAAYREAIRLKPKYAEAHYNLGVALMEQNKLIEASAAYREAIRSNPNHPEAHCNLGDILRRQGKFAESLEAIRRGHELGSMRTGWNYPSATWLKQAERRVELDGKLVMVLKGNATPKDATEQIELAQLCALKGWHANAAQFYADAFSADPRLANTSQSPFRYLAANSSVLAAQASSDHKPTEQERSRLRGQALDWLRADLTVWRKAHDSGNAQVNPVIVQVLSTWLSAPDLATVRDPAALAALPETERAAWRMLWDEVEILRRAASTK